MHVGFVCFLKAGRIIIYIHRNNPIGTWIATKTKRIIRRIHMIRCMIKFCQMKHEEVIYIENRPDDESIDILYQQI